MQTANPNTLFASRKTWFAAVISLIMAGPALTNHPPLTIACSQASGQVMGECTAVVSLDDDVSGTVVVTFENGFSRTLHIRSGAFIRANPTMSGTGRHLEWTLQDNMYLIRVDGQRYEIERSALSPH